ncbi:hypothetical protein COCNU_14G002190 [Cocos nucifera]|uniref:Uncharacterized protein n=1 Tax=Cocos nucifera TaxID=13894 RepID=A0A8K0NBE8_COCNU|nr:hypothetical protein COCNU_14G002190 [Cocos nucifera]
MSTGGETSLAMRREGGEKAGGIEGATRRHFFSGANCCFLESISQGRKSGSSATLTRKDIICCGRFSVV